jgi:hypothetical protein
MAGPTRRAACGNDDIIGNEQLWSFDAARYVSDLVF